VTNRYPKIGKSLQFKRTGENTVEIIDILTEKKWSLNLETAKFVRHLDGKTDPYTIPSPFSKKQIDVLLRELHKRGMFEKNKIRHLPGGTFFFPLWEPKMTTAFIIASYLLNTLVLSLFLPLLFIGIWLFLLHFGTFEFSGAWWGLPIGLISGLLFHEMNHVLASAAYGADVREIGVTIQMFVLPGFYTVIDDKGVKNRLHRIQTSAAGVEMNLFLAGLFLILGAVLPQAGGMFLLAAVLNVFLALMHLMLFKNSDGAAIVSELLGVENIMEKAEAVVRSKEKRKLMMEQGIHGLVGIVISYVLFSLQIVLPILLILNVLEVIAWIV